MNRVATLEGSYNQISKDAHNIMIEEVFIPVLHWETSVPAGGGVAVIVSVTVYHGEARATPVSDEVTMKRRDLICIFERLSGE